MALKGRLTPAMATAMLVAIRAELVCRLELRIDGCRAGVRILFARHRYRHSDHDRGTRIAQNIRCRGKHKEQQIEGIQRSVDEFADEGVVRIVDDPVRTGDSQASFGFVGRESDCCAVHSREYLLRRQLSVVCEGGGIVSADALRHGKNARGAPKAWGMITRCVIRRSAL